MDHVMNIMLTVDPNRSEQTAFSMVARRNTALRVIEVNDKIIGYTVMQLERLRVIIKEHCVDPKWRGKGIGSGALEAFKYTIPHQAGEKHYTTMTVSEENLRAQKLLAEVGFVALKTVLAEEEGVPDSLMFGLLKQ
jgi:ribosomal protein S18 acetylase RimI-like enzyme